jgi:hypothetical protein
MPITLAGSTAPDRINGEPYPHLIYHSLSAAYRNAESHHQQLTQLYEDLSMRTYASTIG